MANQVNLSQDINYWRLQFNSLVTSLNDLDSDVTNLYYLGENENFVKGLGSARFADDVVLSFGDDSDLQIWHDGSNSYIRDDGTGVLYLETNGSGIQLRSTSGEPFFAGYVNGRVDLYYDNVVRFTTESDGAKVTGNLETNTLEIGPWKARVNSDGFVLSLSGSDVFKLDSSGNVEFNGLTNLQSMDSDTRVNLSIVTLSESETLSNKTMTNSLFSDGSKVSIGDLEWSDSETLDPTNGLIQNITLVGDVPKVTYNLDSGESVLVHFRPADSDWTITWDSDVTFINGTSPTLLDSDDTVVLFYSNGISVFANAANGA